MKEVESRYLPRLESDIASLFDYDPVRNAFMGMFGQPLDALYLTIEDFSDNFEERTETFFVLFKELLRRGHLKLQRDNQIIEHTPEEWEAIFREVWPKKIGDKWINVPTEYFSFDEDSIGIWLIADAPAFPVWVNPDDGSLYWA